MTEASGHALCMGGSGYRRLLVQLYPNPRRDQEHGCTGSCLDALVPHMTSVPQPDKIVMMLSNACAYSCSYEPSSSVDARTLERNAPENSKTLPEAPLKQTAHTA